MFPFVAWTCASNEFRSFSGGKLLLLVVLVKYCPLLGLIMSQAPSTCPNPKIDSNVYIMYRNTVCLKTNDGKDDDVQCMSPDGGSHCSLRQRIRDVTDETNWHRNSWKHIGARWTWNKWMLHVNVSYYFIYCFIISKHINPKPGNHWSPYSHFNASKRHLRLGKNKVHYHVFNPKHKRRKTKVP